MIPWSSGTVHLQFMDVDRKGVGPKCGDNLEWHPMRKFGNEEEYLSESWSP